MFNFGSKVSALLLTQYIKLRLRELARGFTSRNMASLQLFRHSYISFEFVWYQSFMLSGFNYKRMTVYWFTQLLSKIYFDDKS